MNARRSPGKKQRTRRSSVESNPPHENRPAASTERRVNRRPELHDDDSREANATRNWRLPDADPPSGRARIVLALAAVYAAWMVFLVAVAWN